MIVGVLVEISNQNVDKVFDYKVPKELEDKIKIGIRVEVPFSKRTLEGFVLNIKNETDIDTKEVISVIDEEQVLTSELLELGKKLKEETLSTLISCYQVMLPKALKAKHNTNISKKYDTYYILNNKVDIKLSKSAEEIINLFKEKDKVKKEDIVKISRSSLNTLVKNNILKEVKQQHYRLKYNNDNISKKELTTDQLKVVEEVRKTNGYEIFLLHGVTGSGKTEVYMELIEDELKKGKTSIVLVPEMSLTPQMVERYEKSFGDKIAALHSALSDGEKYDEYRRIIEGKAKIVIGARSAIFAPLKNIGIIIIDEEHSDTYKQENEPRYNAKDVAKIRGQMNNCKVLMGSATPSLESYARAQKGVYKLLTLQNRANGKSLPQITIVDMNEEMKYSKGHFSKKLIDEINDKLEKKEQVILLLNRRGYSSFITCKNCGYTFKCPNCDITLTYHKSSRTLRCHYCGYGTKVYEECPSCHEHSINDLGVGTEKVEEEIKKIFENARVLRMDTDTTSRKGMHEKMITSFKNHEYDILLGTQIVAKGLDFENVTLVGVINADTSLNIPDFRSSENTFSLLSQVSGRCGRSSKEGNVVLQTFNKDHYAIRYVKKHDYIGFYKEEMKVRQTLKYPPYYYICYLKVSGKDMNESGIEAQKIKKVLDKYLKNSTILGPSTMALFKINNIYRYSIIIKYKYENDLNDVLKRLQDHYKSNQRVRLDIDFNPVHL